MPQQAGQCGGWGGKCCGGEEQHGLSPSVGQRAGCLHKLWALEMLLGPQGKDRVFRKSNYSLEGHFHSAVGEGGQLFSRVTGRKKLFQLLQSPIWRS